MTWGVFSQEGTTDSVRYTVVYDSLTLADDFLEMVDKIMYAFIVNTISKHITD
jgi:hypothetical protein